MRWLPKIFVVLTLFTFQLSVFNEVKAQGEWTWMNGANTINSLGNYGTQGVFAPANSPPSFSEACEWTDLQGNFWLYGGMCFTGNIYGDLWEFNPSINEWAWINGPGIPEPFPVYGTQGIPAPANTPGRRWYSTTWVDLSGNLWLFGGICIDAESDLWKYDITTNEWTWVKGPNTFDVPGVYGTITVPNPANNPGARLSDNASWRDSNNNLWLFGGDYGSDFFNDLWKYSIATNEWTWMNGPNTSSQAQLGNYGAKGVPNPTNIPGGRMVDSKWIDNNDNLNFFAGANRWNCCYGRTYNDFWIYSIVNNEWTWISGDSIKNDSISIGSLCDSSISNKPSARFLNRACWKLDNVNFISFGGTFGDTTGGMEYYYNDMWDYNVITKEWTLMSGSMIANQPNVYGTMLFPNPANHPGGRMGSNGWKDNSGNLWMFGGVYVSYSTDTPSYYNDLWRFTPDCSCPAYSGPPVSGTFSALPLSGCSPLSVTFNNYTINGINYLWTFGDNDTSFVFSPSHTFTNAGTYTVRLIATNACGNGADTVTTTIIANQPAIASFTATDTVGCSPLNVSFINTSTNATSYLWSFGNNVTSNDTNPSFYYDSSGIYTITLIAYGAGGCNDTITRSNYISIDTLRTPISSFTVIPVSGCTPLSVSFTNNSINGTSYYWDFGDTFTDTTTNPTHIYTAGGRDTVKLITTYTSACGSRSDTSTTIITVNITPTVSFTADTLTGCSPLTVTFNNSSSNAIFYLWNFGNTATSTATNPSYNYDSSGIYTVSLIAYGAGGCMDTMVRQNLITILGKPLITGSFIADTLKGCSPFTVHFNNTTSGTGYLWNFGDGSTDTAKNPTHTFLDSGKFTITLIVTSTNDCGTTTDSITYSDYISVNQFNPVAAFTSNYVTPIYTGDSIHFQDESYDLYGSITLWQWWFGDGTGSNFLNPTHEWNMPGLYQVELIVTDNKGCKDSAIYDYIDVIEGIIEIPNIFSPNNDGYNDFFEIKASGIQTFQLDIFNRWGMKLFTSNSINIMWDGYNENGLQCPDGTYYYVLKATGYTGTAYNRAGYVMLIR